jgi:hypothetical protein
MPSSCCNEGAADGFSGATGRYQEESQGPELLAVNFDVETLLPIETLTPRFYLSGTLVPDPIELSLPPSLPPCEPYQPPYVLFLLERYPVNVECICANFGSVLRGCPPQMEFG